jgi:ABC-type bacteriocin/lantibiotic exporter with double-glycine peptidase domain
VRVGITDQIALQLHFNGVGLFLLITWALNIFVPLRLGLVADRLSNVEGQPPRRDIGILILLRYSRSSAGISIVEKYLWIPLDNNATQQLCSAAYNKIMSLSSDFHESKKSGIVWQTVSRGGSVVSLTHIISFEVLPMIIDVCVATSVIWWVFDAYMAFLAAIVVVIYLRTASWSVSKKSEHQRRYLKLREEEHKRIGRNVFELGDSQLFQLS